MLKQLPVVQDQRCPIGVPLFALLATFPFLDAYQKTKSVLSKLRSLNFISLFENN
jgi:hypothetical protein